jgi:hypothetical protein
VPHSSVVRRTAIALMMLSALALGACTSDDDDPTATTSGSGGPTTTGAPLVTSPFCTEMLRLEEEAATAADLATAYRGLLPDVPEEILPEFEVLIARVDAALGDGEPPDPTVADESAFRVAAFVDLECRVTAQSPLPPPVESVARP